MNDISATSLIASLIWGSVGLGFFIYGKKQTAMFPLIGGIALIAISYFLMSSALYMSIAGVAITVAIFWLGRRF